MPAPLQTSSQAQESQILQAAVKCIEASSLLDFTMSAISAEAGLSMGSIYKHIQSKEDVLVALGYRAQLHFEQIARRVMALPLPIVARIVALQLVDVQHTYPYSFGSQLITLLGNEAILRRASPRWLEKYLAHDVSLELFFERLMLDAAEQGELIVAPEARRAMVNEINTATWALCVGHVQVMRHRGARTLGPDEPRLAYDSTVVRGLQRLLNAYPWQTSLTDELLERACGLLADEGLR
jgi:AcrR family transcriptional regulator